MADPVRVGMVGGGPWARNVHGPGLADHPGIEFVGIWTRRPEVAAELAATHGVTAFDDVAALIQDVDAVAFAVPPDVQADLATTAATAGRHVILDKPIAASVASAEKLVKAVEDAGVASIVMLTVRFAPETRDWLASAATTGGWTGGSVRWLVGGLLGGPYAGSPWRHASGAITDVGPHAIDIIDSALGTVTDVVAATYTEPDMWHVLLEHDGGAASTMSLSMKVPVDPPVTEIEIYGTTGRSQHGPRETKASDCFATLLDEFCTMVRSGTTEHPCDVRRGLHLQRIIERAHTLAVTGRQ